MAAVLANCGLVGRFWGWLAWLRWIARRGVACTLADIGQLPTATRSRCARTVLPHSPRTTLPPATATPVAGVGSPFDPNLHDGIMREANNEVPDGTVLEEFRKGFMIGDKLLRPAMVKVSFTEDAAPAAAEGEAAGEAASGSE